MSEPMLKVENLKFVFHKNGKNITAVEDVSFSIDAGTTLCVVGESGCGKSVTATSILQLMPKSLGHIEEGSIRLQGKELTGMTQKELREIRGNEISMIFQEPMTSLNPVYRIGDQMSEMIRAHAKMSKKEAWQKSIEMLGKVGISSPEYRVSEYPHELSGGMRQRVMIAMALSCNPHLLIADEPTTALDVTIQAQILQLIGELKEKFNTAVMLITHDMGVSAEVSDYVMVMYAGKVVEYDTTTNIFHHPMHPYTIGLLNSIPRLNKEQKRLDTIEGTVPSLTNMPKGCRYCTRCPECMDICREKDPGLLEVDGRKVRCWKYAN